MKLCFTALCLATAFIATAQNGSADNSFRLLWFKGKKLSNTSLLTPKGDTISYQPSKGLMKFSARKGGGNKLAAMETELTRTPQRVKEMVTRLNALLPKQAAAFLGEPLGEAFAKIDDEWKEAVSTRLQLPEGHLSIQVPTKTGKGGVFYEAADDLETQVDQFIEEMQTYLQRCKADPNPSIPIPPKADISYCIECNGEAQAQLKKEIEEFELALWGEDQDFMRKVLGVARQLQIMGSDALLTKFYNVYEPFYDYMEGRFVQKARQLINQYADDPEYHAAILPLVLSIERQRQLLGRTDMNGESLMNDLTERTILALDNYIKKAAAEFNYPVMLNAQFILGAERQRQLLGTAKGVDLLQRYIDFNRFKLSVNVATKFGGVDQWGNYAYIISQLRGDNFFAAMPEGDCKLKWVLMGPDKDHLKYKLETGEILSTMKVDYTGTKDWFTEKPHFNLDFCRSGPDTVIARAFTPVGLQESWVYPAPLGTQHFPNIASSIMTCFTDMDKAREDAAKLNEAKFAQVKKDMMALQQQFMQKTKGLKGKDPSKMTPAELARFAQAIQSSDKIMEMVQAPAITNIYVFTKAANRNKIILKERVDGKELFPENPAIQYAYFHIQLEQDNASPYKVY